MPEGLEPFAGQEHTPLISLVFAYYENPSMLELQWKEIGGYPASVKEKLEVLIVDDCSPSQPAADVARPTNLPKHSIYRVDRDIPWNQDAARNIGAHEAQSAWLLLTDIDHLVPADTMAKLVEMQKNPMVFYSFPRIKFARNDPQESHPNSYFMAKDLYWEIGGHDEDFAGIYGKDYLFRKRALLRAPEIMLNGTPLARVGSVTVGDAGTRTISRRNSVWQRIRGYLLEWLKALKLWRGVQTLTESYRRVV